MAKDGKSTYYDAGGIEVVDVIRAKLTHQQYPGFLLGNAIKYQLRMMHKSDTPGEAAFYSAEVVLALRDEEIAQGGPTPYELDALEREDYNPRNPNAL